MPPLSGGSLHHYLGTLRCRWEGASTPSLTYVQRSQSRYVCAFTCSAAAYAFPTRSDAAELGQVANALLIERTSFANPEPASTMPITTLIHDFLVKTDSVDLVGQDQVVLFNRTTLPCNDNCGKGTGRLPQCSKLRSVSSEQIIFQEHRIYAWSSPSCSSRKITQVESM